MNERFNTNCLRYIALRREHGVTRAIAALIAETGVTTDEAKRVSNMGERIDPQEPSRKAA